MPFIETGPRPILEGADPLEDSEEIAPGFFTETIPAAFRTENVIGSIWAGRKAPNFITRGHVPATDFDPFDDIEGYEEHTRAFAYADSAEEVSEIKGRIDRERADRETIAAAGAPGFVAAMAVGFVDPTILIPVGGQLKKGETLLRLATRTALAGAGGAAVQEGILQSTQHERTLTESALNISATALLSGVLGGGFGALTKRAQADMAAKVEADMLHPGDDIDPFDPFETFPFDASSVGAAKAAPGSTVTDTLADNAIAYVEGVAKKANLVDPSLQLMTSPSNGARTLGQELAEIPLLLEKNRAKFKDVTLPDGTIERRLVYGKPTSQAAESAIKRKTELFLGEAQSELSDIYVRYLNGSATRAPGERFMAGVRSITGTLPEGKLKPAEFNKEVWSALARGDKHDIAEVAEAAARIREKLFKPLEDEAVDLGMFGVERIPGEDGAPDTYINRRPELGPTAESYRPRLYNLRKIAARRDEFIQKIYDHFVSERGRFAAEADALEQQAASVRGDIDTIRGEIRSVLKARNRAAKEAREEIARAEKAAAKQSAVAREKTTQAKAAAAREKAVTTPPELPENERLYFKGLLRDVKRGHADERAESLLEFVRRNGGISDLDAAFGSDLYRRLNVARKAGKDMDYMRELAGEAGYIDDAADLNDFIDLLGQEFRGEKVFSDADVDIIANENYLTDLLEAASEDGVDLNSVEAFASWFRGEKYIKRTPFKKGRVSEAHIREKYAQSRLIGEAEKSAEMFDALHEARAYARTLRENAPALTKRANELRKAARQAVRARKFLDRDARRLGIRAEVGDEDLLRNAQRTVQRIESTPAGRLSFDDTDATSGLLRQSKKNAANLSGRFKSRRLTIPDEVVEDFLEDDLEMLMRATTRSMVSDIELTRKFGSVDMEPQIKALADEFEDLIAKVDPKAKNAEAQRAALKKKRDQAIKNVIGIRDRLRGTHGLPENPDSIGFRTIQTAKSLNHLRLMGGVTISSFPDVARTALSNGFANFSSAGTEFFTKGLSRLSPTLDEIRLAGSAWEVVNDTRTMALSDILDDYGRHSKLERVIGQARNNFGQLSLMAPWNHAQKSIAGLTTQNRILRGSRDLVNGKISKQDAEFMARLGISEDDARAIAAKFREFGSDDRIAQANTRAWGDDAESRRLADVFHNAIRKEVDRIIVTPGQEKPLFTDTPLGSLIFQFQSYNFAATQRVSLAMAQGMRALDAHTYMTLGTQIAIGMIVAQIKMWEAGRSTEEWSERRWLSEGIDRSGVLGAMTYINLLTERASAGRIGLSGLAGEGPLSRYHTRNTVGAFLGPSAGAASDVFTTTSALFQSDVKEGDIAALRRLLPYQNLFYLRHLFDEIEKAVGPREEE